MNNSKTAKRVVRSLSVQEKLIAIDRVHSGESKAAVARGIGVPESTLRGWCKNEEKLRATISKENSPEGTRDSSPSCEFPLDFSRKTPSPAVIVPKTISFSPARDHVSHSPVEKDKAASWKSTPPPLIPLEARVAEQTGSWFWQLYKNDSIFSQLSHPLKTKSADAFEVQEYHRPSGDVVYHGEQFLKWLEDASDPSITAMQILQFRCLLKNVKECTKRSKDGHVTKPPRRRPSRK